MTTTIKKLQFAEGTTVAEPTDLTISEVIKEFVTYANDAAYESANPGFGNGATYYNTGSDLLRTYRGGTWTNLAYESVAQTFSNKTLTSPVINTSISGTILETDLSSSASSSKVATAAATKTYVDAQIAIVGSSSAPSGMMAPFAGSSAPTGWFLCDGQAVSRTTYANLFTAIGTTYGTGDGSTTFNVPDMRGVFARGAGTNGTADYGGLTGHTPAGGSLGNKGRQFTARNGLALTGSVTMSGAGAHTHDLDHSASSGSSAGRLGPAAGGSSGLFAVAQSNPGNHTHTITNTMAVGAGDSETTPAFLAVNYIIKF